MIEVLVAMLILAVGLIGMAGVTMIVMRGGKGAEDLANVTNICQQKIEELKNLSWPDLGNATGADPADLQYTLGLQSQGMSQKNDLNAQGLTRAELYTQQYEVLNSACYHVADTDPACELFLNKAGPYKYSITFSVCNGQNYVLTGGVPDAPSGSDQVGSNANPSSFPYSAAPNCLVDPADGTTRAAALVCDNQDIITVGPTSPEKMIKILCTWRTKEGNCHFVNFESLRMNNL